MFRVKSFRYWDERGGGRAVSFIQFSSRKATGLAGDGRHRAHVAHGRRVARGDAPLRWVPAVACGSCACPDIDEEEVSGSVDALDVDLLTDDQIDDCEVAEVADMTGAHIPAMHVIDAQSSKPVFARD